MENTIVSVDWLSDNSENENLIILDASPVKTASGKVSELAELCIPESRVFNIKDHFSDKESSFPNTVPTATSFEKECKRLGVNMDSQIIVYDNLGIYSSPRVWWLFKVMGHDNISVLNGGLPEWHSKGFKTIPKTELKNDYGIGDFTAKLQEDFIVKFADVLKNNINNEFVVVDARSKGRFDGTDPEPRKHLQSGHIPNSISIPFTTLLEENKFKEPAVLNDIFESKISDPKKMIFSCGSGMTACIVMLATEIAFKKGLYLYDGSWAEYAELQNLKIINK